MDRSVLCGHSNPSNTAVECGTRHTFRVSMASMKGLTALVTGSGSGIGRGIAQLMCRRGAMVGVADLNMKAAEDAASEITSEGGTAIPIKMDVTDEDEVMGGIDLLANTFGDGRIDCAVSNAGFQHIEAIETLSLENWRKMMAVHLDGAFLLTKGAFRYMKMEKEGRRGGSILFMGSVHSKEASLLKSPYIAAKHALMGLNRSVAKEGAQYGIRSNLICPGFVLTPLVEKQIPEQAANLGISEERVIKEIMLKSTVDGEFSTIEDVAEVACFLAAHKTNALTGQSMNVSHGWSMT